MNAFSYPSKRGINFAKIRGFKDTDYSFCSSGARVGAKSCPGWPANGRAAKPCVSFARTWASMFRIANVFCNLKKVCIFALKLAYANAFNTWFFVLKLAFANTHASVLEGEHFVHPHFYTPEFRINGKSVQCCGSQGADRSLSDTILPGFGGDPEFARQHFQNEIIRVLFDVILSTIPDLKPATLFDIAKESKPFEPMAGKPSYSSSTLTISKFPLRISSSPCLIASTRSGLERI